MVLTKRAFAFVAGLLAIATTLEVSAQTQLTPEQAKARLEVGAAFLKSGDTDLATKTFAGVVDADPTNWQARSLLTLAYLSVRALDKVDLELNRLRTQKTPAATMAALERQVAAVRQMIEVRDALVRLLDVGKWQETLTSIDGSGLTDSRKQLLRGYVAALRGEFAEARRLTSDPQYAAVNASIAKREQEFQAARERALVAFNILGYRYCGNYPGEMRRCVGQAPLSPEQQTAWNEVRAGGGKLDPSYMRDKTGWPRGAGREETIRRNQATVARVEVALAVLNEFVRLAPLHPEALRVTTVSSLWSGSQTAVREAAERSLNAGGTWQISTRRCHGRQNYYCSMGDEKVETLPNEGLIVFDARSRVLQYFEVAPVGWITSFTPVPAAKVFEIPFDKVTQIQSRPTAKYGASYLDTADSVVFGFDAKNRVSMWPDSLLLMKFENLVPTAMGAVSNLVNVMGQLLPGARVDFEAVADNGSGFGRAMAMVAGVSGAVAGDAGLIQQSQQIRVEQQQQAARAAALQRSIADMRTQDGQSVMDVAFEEEGLKRDLDALLTTVLQ